MNTILINVNSDHKEQLNRRWTIFHKFSQQRNARILTTSCLYVFVESETVCQCVTLNDGHCLLKTHCEICQPLWRGLLTSFWASDCFSSVKFVFLHSNERKRKTYFSFIVIRMTTYKSGTCWLKLTSLLIVDAYIIQRKLNFL